jgi:hypothetical protein
MKLLHHAHTDSELDVLLDRVLTWRAFPVSGATYDPEARTYEVVLFDRGLAETPEDPQRVVFVPELLLRFNEVDRVTGPEAMVADPYEIDVYQFGGLRYEHEHGEWLLQGRPWLELRVAAPHLNVELYEIRERE